MSLINNPYNQPDRQQEKEVAECVECGGEIYEGNEVYKMDSGEFLCNSECFRDYVGYQITVIGE